MTDQPGSGGDRADREIRDDLDDAGVSSEERSRAISTLLGFCALNQACRLYDINNAVITRVLEEMLGNVQAISRGKEPVSLTTAGHSFFLNRTLVRMGYTEYQKAQQLKEIWGRLGITEVVFPPDLTGEGLKEFAVKVIEALKDPGQAPELARRPWGGITARLVLGGGGEQEVREQEEVSQEDEARSARDNQECELAVRIYCGLIVLVLETLEQFQRSQWSTLLRIKQTLQVLVDKLENHEGLLVALTSSAVYRETLASHLTNSAILTLILGRRLGLPRRDLIALATAALFHDIAKVNLKDDTLNALEHGATLQQEARQRVQMHWMNTLNKLVLMGGFAEETLPRLVVGYESQLEFSHGRLYPEEMGLGHPHAIYSHVISLCDRYDNMLWSRTGKEAATPHRAMLSLLNNFQKQYAPALTELFVRTIGLYPTGSVVRLDSQELAVVTAQDPDGAPERPEVTLICGPDGGPLDGGQVLALARDSERTITLSEDAVQLGINPISLFLGQASSGPAAADQRPGS